MLACIFEIMLQAKDTPHIIAASNRSFCFNKIVIQVFSFRRESSMCVLASIHQDQSDFYRTNKSAFLHKSSVNDPLIQPKSTDTKLPSFSAILRTQKC